jgi:predicted metal-binding membrane protein
MSRALAVQRRRFVTFHPEWWVVGAVVAAWPLFLVLADTHGASPGSHHHLASTSPALWRSTPLVGLLLWITMTVAMMLPTNVAAVRYVAFASRRSRRNRAIAWFVVGFVAAWLPVGLVAAWIHVIHPATTWVVLALAGAALWELSPWKRRALLRCRRSSPIRLRGAAARRSCAEYGGHVGWQCLVSCGPAMLALAVAGHPLLLTGFVAGGMFGRKS